MQAKKKRFKRSQNKEINMKQREKPKESEAIKERENLDYTSPNPLQKEAGTEKNQGQDSVKIQNEQIQLQGQLKYTQKTQSQESQKAEQTEKEYAGLKRVEYLESQINNILDRYNGMLDLIEKANEKIKEISLMMEMDKAFYDAKTDLNEAYYTRLESLEKGLESLKNDQEGINEALITEIKAMQETHGNTIQIHARELEFQRNLIKKAEEKIIATQTTGFSDNLKQNSQSAKLWQEVEYLKEEQKALRNEIANARFLVTNYKEKTLWQILKMKLS